MTDLTYSDKKELLRSWWWTHLGNRDVSHCRSRSAKWRRGEVLTILADQALHTLAKDLNLSLTHAPALLRVSQTLAYVREVGSGLPRRLGGAEPVLSPLRFERLIRSDDAHIATAVRRALPLVNHACDPGQLALDMLYWTNKTRTRWTFEYFSAPPPKIAREEEEA